MFTLLLLVFTSPVQAVTTYEPAQTVFVNKCSECHGDFVTVPSFRFLKNTAFFFDVPNGGKRQKMPPRMAGIRITEEEALVLKAWLLEAAPDMDGNPTLSPEQLSIIFKN